jgi:DNA-binding PadR family transcriptional regulator
MNSSTPENDKAGCHRRRHAGDFMHDHSHHHRRERWHMKMHRMGAHRRGTGRGRGPRPLGHGDLRLLILGLIAESPRHGYDLIQEIEARTGGSYKPSPGVIYPALEIIQDLGWAIVRTDDGKKTFHITQEGQAELAREAATIAAIQARLASLLSGEDEADPADVRTAMHRLRHAVITAARDPAASEARLTRIAEILAAARDEIAALD